MATKTHRLFAYLLLGSMIGTSAFGMQNKKPNPCKRLANGIRHLNPLRLFKYLNPLHHIRNNIRNIHYPNQANIQHVADSTVHAILNSLNNPQNAQALVGAVKTLFNSSAQVVQQQFGQDGNGSQAIRALFNAVANNLGNLWANGQGDNQGAGKKALNKFFEMINDALRENGEIARIIQQFFNRSDVVSQGIGISLERMFREVNQKFSLGLRDFLGRANHELGAGLKNAGNHFAENGKGREALENVRGAVRDKITGENGILGETLDLLRSNAWKFGGIAAVSTLGIATAFFGTKWLWGTYIKWWFKKPHVIIDSSKKRSLWSRMFGAQPDFPKMVFAPHLKKRLDHLVLTTKSITKKIKQGKKNVKYRNLLLWGPPGTGKTMFAQQLAEKSGMDWVMVTGSSFFQKNAGIKSIDELFRWSEKSRKGLLIFIDEADSLLPDRSKLKPGTENYQIVNHFLNYLGKRSQKFMVVMSTNHKSVFDSAMQRRIDDLINMPLPGHAERVGVLKLYRGRVLLDAQENTPEFISSVQKHLNDRKINDIAKRTNGLSNGDLSGIINTIITESNEVITPNIIEVAVQRALQKHQDFNPGKRRARIA